MLEPGLFCRKVGNTLFIYGKAGLVNALVALEGTGNFIEESVLEPFRDWLKRESVDTAGDKLGVSRAQAGRLKKALGLSSSYTGGSKTTKWRVTKKG